MILTADRSRSTWFVMLRSQTGEFPLPMVDLEDEIALFDSAADATKAGNDNMIGAAFGFEIFEWPR